MKPFKVSMPVASCNQSKRPHRSKLTLPSSNSKTLRAYTNIQKLKSRNTLKIQASSTHVKLEKRVRNLKFVNTRCCHDLLSTQLASERETENTRAVKSINDSNYNLFQKNVSIFFDWTFFWILVGNNSVDFVAWCTLKCPEVFLKNLVFRPLPGFVFFMVLTIENSSHVFHCEFTVTRFIYFLESLSYQILSTVRHGRS